MRHDRTDRCSARPRESGDPGCALRKELNSRFRGNERKVFLARALHTRSGLRNHFRYRRIVARRHDVDAGDAGNGGKLFDQLDADADAFARRFCGFFQPLDKGVGDDGAEEVTFHPGRRLRRAQRIDADEDGKLFGHAGGFECADIAAHDAASMQNCVCANCAPALTLARSAFGLKPAGGSIGMSAPPMKNSALPSTLRPLGNVPSSRSRRAVSISVFKSISKPA